jgi:hypothetical protein
MKKDVKREKKKRNHHPRLVKDSERLSSLIALGLKKMTLKTWEEGDIMRQKSQNCF